MPFGVSVVVFSAFLNGLMTIPIILFFAIGLLCADEFPKVYNSESNKKSNPPGEYDRKVETQRN